MSSEAYELLALLMRYVFVLIGALIVWRSFRWLRRDARAYKREMRALPDAGLIGEMVNLYTGEAQPLPREGTIGTGRACDIRLKDNTVKRQHVRFAFEEGKGLRLTPLRNCTMLVSGVPFSSHAYALHGTQIQIGQTPLRVRLFAGLNIPQPAAYPEPDAILSPGIDLGDWAGPGEQAPAFPDATMLSGGQEAEAPPYTIASVSPGQAASYEGNFTEDGQMTWQYAYSMDELQSAMQNGQWQQAQPTDSVPDEEENAYPYESPLPPRKRRRRRG